jgi:hypothetical protein
MSAIGLQLAPSAHVTEDMRRAVLAAVTDAGIDVGGWVPLLGEANPTAWSVPVAQPSFRLIVSGSVDRSAEEVLLELGARVADALARVRSSVPSVPVSINAVSDDRRRWFSFRPSDSPDAVRRGVAALPTVLNGQDDALGWDDAPGKWIVL